MARKLIRIPGTINQGDTFLGFNITILEDQEPSNIEIVTITFRGNNGRTFTLKTGEGITNVDAHIFKIDETRKFKSREKILPFIGDSDFR